MKYTGVYKSVDGPKLRRLYKDLKCSKFEALGILYFLWDWGLDNADRSGLLLNVGRDDVARYLYGVGSECRLDMNLVVDALIENGWLDEAPDGLYLHDWEQWQAPWYKAKDRRAKDAQRKAESRRTERAAADFQQTAIPETHAVPEPVKEEPEQESMFGNTEAQPSRRKSESAYAKAFEEFWAAYPRKIEKGNAYKKYQARRNDGYSDEELIGAAKSYATECKKQRTEKKYIKHPKTFLSETLPFADYLPGRKAEETKERPPVSRNPFEEWGDDND